MTDHSPGFLALVERARARVAEIPAAELPAALSRNPDAVLIDIREDHEWQAGHLAGATHLARGIIERDIEQRFPDPATSLYLYCGGGYRSVLSAESLQLMGYTRVYSVAGGWRALKELMPLG